MKDRYLLQIEKAKQMRLSSIFSSDTLQQNSKPGVRLVTLNNILCLVKYSLNLRDRTAHFDILTKIKPRYYSYVIKDVKTRKFTVANAFDELDLFITT